MEMLVASAIFTVVTIVAVGAILTVNDANRKTQAIRAIVDNLNFAMESMSRQLRTGTNYHCVRTGENLTPPPLEATEQECVPAADGSSAIYFTSAENINDNAQGRTVVYRLEGQGGCPVFTSSSGSTLRSASCRGKITTWDTKASGGLGNYVDMTPPEIDVRDLRFYVQTSAFSQQPRVLITVAGIIILTKEKIETPFNIQTMVTQRLKLTI